MAYAVRAMLPSSIGRRRSDRMGRYDNVPIGLPLPLLPLMECPEWGVEWAMYRSKRSW